MLQILGFFLLIILLVILVPILILTIWGINKFYAFKQKLTGQSRASTRSSSSSSSSTATTASSFSAQHGKIIPKDEGEYVEFEEV